MTELIDGCFIIIVIIITYHGKIRLQNSHFWLFYLFIFVKIYKTMLLNQMGNWAYDHFFLFGPSGERQEPKKSLKIGSSKSQAFNEVYYNFFPFFFLRLHFIFFARKIHWSK